MSAAKLRLYWRLQLAAHFSQKAADRELLATGNITTAQTGVLSVIANGTNVSQKNVALALGLNESAVTAMVRRLVALNYINISQNNTDARARVLTLTEAGKEIQEHARAPFETINEKIEATLSPTEVAKLANYLERLTAAFESK
ncbi:MAG: MarR family transcriptional regulator [Pseudomonadota bacterium]